MFTRGRRAWIALTGVTVLLVAATACSPAPAPTAAPAKTEPAAAAKTPDNLFLMMDMVQGSTNIPDAEKATKSCVLNSRYPKNSQIVWRGRVFDPRTGNVMDDKALSSVTVTLANGTTVAMKFGPHPKDPPNESFWTGSWVIPKTQASGTLGYSVLATATDGRKGEFKPFPTATSLLTITDESLPDAPAKPKS